MRSPLEIRTPRGDEASKLYDLVRRFSTSFTPDRSSFDVSFTSLLNDESTDLLCCFLEGEMCGYVLAFHHPAFFAGGLVTWVEEVYVADEVRRQGVGTELVHEIEARAAERGSTLVALATRRSHEFYRWLGYEESATYFRRVL